MVKSLVVVVGIGPAERRQGMDMQAALEVRAEFLNQVVDQDLAHLLMAELHALYQGSELMMGIPIGRDHSRPIGPRNLWHVEHRAAILPVVDESPLQGV